MPCFAITPAPNKKIDAFLEKARKELDALYGVSFPAIPNMLLIASRKDMDKIRGKKTPDWLVAWTDHGAICILNPKIYEKDSCHKGDFWQVLKHEYCHIYHHRITGNMSFPHWLIEGSACYFAKQFKTKPSERELLAVFSNHDPKNVYNVGIFWTEVIVKEFGEKKLIQFIKSIDANTNVKNFSALFKKNFGIPFSLNWGRKMTKKYLAA